MCLYPASTTEQGPRDWTGLCRNVTHGVASKQDLVELELLVEEAAHRGVEERGARVVVVALEAHEVLVHRGISSGVVRLVELDCRTGSGRAGRAGQEQRKARRDSGRQDQARRKLLQELEATVADKCTAWHKSQATTQETQPHFYA